MWYKNFTFFGKSNGLNEAPISNFFYQHLTKEELLLYPDIKTLYPEFIENDKLKIPTELTLTSEHRELLEYSNGGGIINGDREFGYFSLQDIRYYYFAYGFPKWTPFFLPIAFNGGGKFYAYDFRNLKDIKVIAVGSGDLDYESSVVLGNTLEEVLNKKSNIEDELDSLYPEIPLTDLEIRNQEIKTKLIELKKAKLNGNIELKVYLKEKRQLETEIKEMNILNK